MDKARQLSLFNDAQVRRSFLSRFAINPRRELIKQLRLENLHGVRIVLQEPTGYAHIQRHSANHHFVNKHAPFVKEGRRYFYN